MSGIGLAFRWLDILEKEFDKTYVDLDVSIGELEAEEPELAVPFRQQLGTLSSCWAQLSHKSQTIFQISSKTEAELVNLREELTNSQAQRDVLQGELQALVRAVREATTLEQVTDRLPTLSAAAESHTTNFQLAQAKAQAYRYQKENDNLRNTILALQSEVYGARLAAKYLDKELAGRIQQLQLLGREMKGALRDKLWRQLEAEILLQRHKTVVRACRSANASPAACGPPPPALRGLGEPREVVIQRDAREGLGFSITGGREHGVPILISELEVGGAASRCQQLYVGDAILKVNNTDLQQASHQEAVAALQGVTGTCTLVVQFIAADSDEENSLSEDGYNFQYKFFEGVGVPRPDCTEITPTAPRTPEPDNTNTGLTLTMDNFVDDDNNIETLAIPIENTTSPLLMFDKSRPDGAEPAKTPDTPETGHRDAYQSPMRESADSSDNLLSIISSDEQSPKTYKYQVMGQCRNNANAHDIFEPQRDGQFRKPDWLETLTVKEIETESSNQMRDATLNTNKNFVNDGGKPSAKTQYADPYYYYVDQENYYNSAYRNSSLNSSVSSTPVHKRYTRQNLNNSPELNPGIRTIDQIFNKKLNVSMGRVDNAEAMSTDSSYSCHIDKIGSPSNAACGGGGGGGGGGSDGSPGVEIVELDPKDASDNELFPLKSGIIQTINSAMHDQELVDNGATSPDASEDNQSTGNDEATIRADRERLQKCFSSKSRNLRIGYARRVPPKDDAVHIPLKPPPTTPTAAYVDLKESCRTVEIVQPDVTMQAKQPPMQVSSNQTQHNFINGRGDPEIGTPV